MEPVEDIANTLSHDELLEITQSSLYTLTKCDSLLNDLPSDIILEEVLSQIAVEHGQSIMLTVNRENEPAIKVIVSIGRNKRLLTNSTSRLLKNMDFVFLSLKNYSYSACRVIVPQNASVLDLKKAVKRHFELYQKRTGSKVKISWKYIWRTYNLCYDSTVLESNEDCIENYGVTNKVTLNFKKQRRKKNKLN